MSVTVPGFTISATPSPFERCYPDPREDRVEGGSAISHPRPKRSSRLLIDEPGLGVVTMF